MVLCMRPSPRQLLRPWERKIGTSRRSLSLILSCMRLYLDCRALPLANTGQSHHYLTIQENKEMAKKLKTSSAFPMPISWENEIIITRGELLLWRMVTTSKLLLYSLTLMPLVYLPTGSIDICKRMAVSVNSCMSCPRTHCPWLTTPFTITLP